MQGNRILLTIQVLILILTTVWAKAQTAHGQSRFVPADTVQSTSTAPKKEIVKLPQDPFPYAAPSV